MITSTSSPTTPGAGDWIRSLGSTGLQVPAVCVGGSPLGSMPEAFGYEVTSTDAIDFVLAVLDSPIRMIDTANGYSDGESERRIGAAVAAYGGLPDDFLIATKVDAQGADYSSDRVRASVSESKARLGLDQLPLVFLHDPEFHDFDAMTAPGGAVETLMALRADGEIGHVGLAGGDVHVMSRYLALGGYEALLVHNRWTLVDRSATALLAQAEADGVAVVNAAVYGGGILARPDAGLVNYGYRPAPEATLSAIAAMSELCREHGTDLGTAALQASVRDARVAYTVVGMSRRTRISSTMESLAQPLPDAFFDQLDALRPGAEHWLDAPV